MSVVLGVKRGFGYDSPEQQRMEEETRISKRCRAFTPTSPPKPQGLFHRTRPQMNPGSIFQPTAAEGCAGAGAIPAVELAHHFPQGKRRRLPKLADEKAMVDEGDSDDSDGGAGPADLDVLRPMDGGRFARAGIASGDSPARMLHVGGGAGVGGKVFGSALKQPQQHGAGAGKQGQEEEVRFTVSQVRAIVESALAEKEAELSARYDRILGQRLQEQFNLFTKFNEDHIHQKLSSSQHMYMS